MRLLAGGQAWLHDTLLLEATALAPRQQRPSRHSTPVIWLRMPDVKFRILVPEGWAALHLGRPCPGSIQHCSARGVLLCMACMQPAQGLVTARARLHIPISVPRAAQQADDFDLALGQSA